MNPTDGDYVPQCGEEVWYAEERHRVVKVSVSTDHDGGVAVRLALWDKGGRISRNVHPKDVQPVANTILATVPLRRQ